MCLISLIEGVKDGEKRNEEEEVEENDSGEQMEEDKDSGEESKSKFSISIFICSAYLDTLFQFIISWLFGSKCLLPNDQSSILIYRKGGY